MHSHIHRASFSEYLCSVRSTLAIPFGIVLLIYCSKN